MRSRLPHGFLGLAFLALAILALATGMTARPVPSEMDLRLEAWLVSGASLDNLCGDHGGNHKGEHCPLCNLAAPGGLLPVPVSLLDAEQRILASIVLPQMRRAAGHARDPAIPKRGPPHLI